MVLESKKGQGIGAHLLIRGRVQGVGYRFFTQDLAQNFGLAGWVRNLPDGNVEAFAQGPRAVIEVFIDLLEQSPSMARVEAITVDWQSPSDQYTSFSILS